MIHWQRIWDDDGNERGYGLVKIIASLLSFFYLFIINFRNWLYDRKILRVEKLACPVISVGNITVGGTGKTPCVIMLARMLQEKGFKPAVISRGYGGRGSGPFNIVSDGDQMLLDSRTAGDEPCLMARTLKGIPVITGAKRTIAGQAAIDTFGANVLICDDAMQHRQIFRDVNLVLMDSKSLRGKNYLLPRGRLREPLKELRRADALLLTRSEEGAKTDEKKGVLRAVEKIPVFRSVHQPKDMTRGDFSEVQPISGLKGKKVFAFCGIANPASFEKTLRAVQVNLAALKIFADHHRFDEKEVAALKAGFVKSGADDLVTTEKDAMRLQAYPEFLKEIFILRVEMEIKPDARSFEDFIINKLKLCQRTQKG